MRGYSRQLENWIFLVVVGNTCKFCCEAGWDRAMNNQPKLLDQTSSL